MATTTPPPSARSHYAAAALVAQRAAREARRARPRGFLAAWRVLVTHQTTQAVLSERAVGEMLAEQDIEAAPDALLNSTAFTTEASRFEQMVSATDNEAEFDRLVASLVQDAGRAAESVATAVRPDVHHVRYVTPPCCGRCAVLAGRVYRWSDGFERHPNCDCVMVPTTVAAPFVQSPESLFEAGQIRNLSKADAKAIRDGADVGQVVNVRRAKAGLSEAGRVLARRDRPTPEGIYRIASDRDEAVALLSRYGYVR